MVLSTQGTDGGQYGMRLPVTYEPGVVAMDVLRCVEYTVNGQAELVVRMDRGEPRVLFPVELMDGSGLCGFAFEKGGKGSYKSAEVGGAGGQRVRVSGLVRVVVAVGVVLCSGYVGAW